MLAMNTLADTDWRSPIVNYLKDPSIDTERKIKYRALSYVLIRNKLFKKTPEGVLLKCLGENEACLALFSVHSGASGAHQAGLTMKWLLFRYGIYCPTVLKIVKSYLRVVRNVKFMQASNMPLQANCNRL